MEITLKSLKKKEKERVAWIEDVDWFKENFGESADSKDVLKKLDNAKCSTDFVRWLFVNYSLSGICKFYHSNGILEQKSEYKNGWAHGLNEIWGENGIKTRERSYINGERHGLSIGYFEKDGSWLFTEIWNNGNLIEKRRTNNGN